MVDSKTIYKSLSAHADLDVYLSRIARQYETHAFIKGAMQGCYIRWMSLIDEIWQYRGRSPSGVRILDWGCGKGHNSYLLSTRGYKVSSCDVESGVGDSSFDQDTPIIKERGIHVHGIHHDWELPYEDHSFDMVVSFGVLEHVPDDRQSLKEIRRILVPNGVFFFVCLPYCFSLSQRVAHLRGDMYHAKLYSEREVHNMASQSGFMVEHIWHGQLFPKNSIPHCNLIEAIDRWLTFRSPLKYFATNLEGILIAV